jgi:hypothetical protein
MQFFEKIKQKKQNNHSMKIIIVLKHIIAN